jgi:uncharacterized membrane protein
VATLTAWKFEDPDKAEEAMGVLENLRKQELIHVIDAAWVAWQPGKKGPKTHQLHNTTAAGALGGGFWGLLFGLIFFVPILGLAIGAAAGAAIGKLADVGIDDDFIKEVREKVTPGTSALFALTDDAVQDRVREAFKGFHAELISSNLSADQEKELRETFFAE